MNATKEKSPRNLCPKREHGVKKDDGGIKWAIVMINGNEPSWGVDSEDVEVDGFEWSLLTPVKSLLKCTQCGGSR